MGAHIACVLGDGRHKYWALRCHTHWDGNLTAGGTLGTERLSAEPLHPLGWEGPLCDGGGALVTGVHLRLYYATQRAAHLASAVAVGIEAGVHVAWAIAPVETGRVNGRWRCRRCAHRV